MSNKKYMQLMMNWDTEVSFCQRKGLYEELQTKVCLNCSSEKTIAIVGFSIGA